MINFNDLEEVEILDIHKFDYPDFVDAYVNSAIINGRELSEEELDWVNDNCNAEIQEFALEEYVGRYL